MADCDAAVDAAAQDAADAAAPRWTRLHTHADHERADAVTAPAPRSGHAMALLAPTRSVLLFGGSDGRVFFNDFFLLEPAQYGAPESVRTSHDDVSRAGSASMSASATMAAPALVWKKLVVSHAGAAYAASFLASSFGSDGGGSGSSGSGSGSATADTGAAGVVVDEKLDSASLAGCGRDYHTMHYVPSSAEEERARGMRVLVLGNIVVSCARDGDDDAQAYDADEMRVEEVRVRQPLLDAQWLPRRIKSMWKPRARQAHSSVLLGDQLFCFGGKNATSSVFFNDMFYYDVALNQWRHPPSSGSLPAPRAFPGMTASETGEQIFIYGGYDGKQQFGGMYVFNVSDCRWDKVVPRGIKPGPRINHSLTFVRPHHIVLFGGRQRSVRQNDLYVFDTTTSAWKQLSATTSASAQGRASQAISTVEQPSAPVGRTAHCAIYYQYHQRHRAKRILIFGGYAGSHRWLNDLHAVDLPVTALSVQQPPQMIEQERRPVSSTSSIRDPPAQDGSLTESQSLRTTSRSESPFVLSDITNHPPSAMAAPPTPQRYTPAATAAMKKLQRIRSETPATSIFRDPMPHKKRKRFIEGSSQSESTEPRDSVSPVGLQTTLIQVLQHQQRIEGSVVELSRLVRDDHTFRNRERGSMQECFLRTQNEQLEQRLEAMTRRLETSDNRVQSLESAKQVLHEQLIAAETEIYMYKRNMDELVPSLGAKVLGAIEKANRQQFTSSSMIEAKISSIHDLLEDIRHSSGERTETDESPQKRDSMFPEDASDRHTPVHALMYPQGVVHDLERQLQAVVEANRELQLKVATMEEKLKRAEANSQRIQQLSMAWLLQEEETKG